MFSHHVKLSLRSMKKSPVFTGLNIAGFAVGFAVCMVLALYAYKEYTVDQGYPDHDNIYRVIDARKNSTRIDFDLAAQFKEQFPDVREATPVNFDHESFGGNPIFLKRGQGEEYVLIKQGISTTNAFFGMFSVKVLAGNSKQPFADMNSVVLSRSTAQKLFGRTDVLGEMVNMADIFTLSVSAVVEDLPENSSMGADLYFNGDNEQFRFSRSCANDVCHNPIDIYVQLNPRADPRQQEAAMNAHFPGNKSKTDSIKFQPLADIYLTPGIEGNQNKVGSRSLIRIFLTIALLIMLLSVINYVNYSLSKQLSTLREIGIKITNGADTAHLKAYYFTEVALSVLISFVLALGLTVLLLPYAGLLLNTSLVFGQLFSPVLMGVFVFIILAVILISSLAPVYIISHFDVQRLFGKTESVLGKQIGKKILTVFQLMTTIALIASLLIIQKQLYFVKSADLGFNKERLLRIDFGKRYKNQDVLKQKMDASPYVQSSSFSNGAPGSIFTSMSADMSGKTGFLLDCIFIDNEFLKTFDIRLLEGREFADSDLENSCYINETAFKKYGWENLENRVVDNYRDGGLKVVGVVRDFKVASMHQEITPVCMLFMNKYTSLNLRLAPGNLTEQMESIRAIWKELEPERPIMFTFYDAHFDAFYRKEQRQARAIGFFSLITVIITCMGLMGQIFQSSMSRTKEIGVRKVNGAKVSEVMTLLNKDFVALVIVAFVLATPIAWFAMNKWLEGFAYKTTLSWWIFALAGLLALGIALITVSWQSWKAATRNPVESLRNE